jgi:hypothetical protein
MSEMFRGACKFKQSLTRWDTASLIRRSDMFDDVCSTFSVHMAKKAVANPEPQEPGSISRIRTSVVGAWTTMWGAGEKG